MTTKPKKKVREWTAWASISRYSHTTVDDMSMYTTKQSALVFQRQIGKRDEVIKVKITEVCGRRKESR